MVKEVRPYRTYASLALLLLLPTLIWYLGQTREQSQGPEVQMKPGTLLPPAYKPLALGSVRPRGWLLDELKRQASGITGHLDEFWPDVAQSGWIGGRAEGWERAPYWLDGVVPLAYLTDDPRLKKKVSRWMDYILRHQRPDGWLGPEKSPAATGSHNPSPDPRDPWPQFILLKALSQYQEATGDPRVIPAMQKDLRAMSAEMDKKPLFSWNNFRWGDLLVSLYWLHDKTNEPWLLDLAEKARNQGYDWTKHFGNLPVKEKSKGWNWEGHVVNNAMGLKAPALVYRLTGTKDF